MDDYTRYLLRCDNVVKGWKSRDSTAYEWDQIEKEEKKKKYYA